MKLCKQCGFKKELTEFYKNKSKKDGLGWHCKSCTAHNSKVLHQDPEYKKKRRERLRGTWVKGSGKREQIKREYGITLEEYTNLLESQGGKCLICGISSEQLGRALHLDHCHETQKIRGFLCQYCNQGLGLFKDDPKLLIKAKEYLEIGLESGLVVTGSRRSKRPRS